MLSYCYFLYDTANKMSKHDWVCCMQYLVRSGWAALRGAAWGCQAVQVCHDDYSCLPQINCQVIILRQCKVAQKTLIWAQRGRKDLRTKVVRYKTWRTAQSEKWFTDSISPRSLLREQAPPYCCGCSGSAAGGAVKGRWYPGLSAHYPSLWFHCPRASAAAELQTAADYSTK